LGLFSLLRAGTIAVFLGHKKDSTHRVVQDFCSLNAKTYVDKYSTKDVQECISEIGCAGSTIFTTLDLTSGFWQMALDPKSRPYTAFTVPGMGQFEWKVVSMGLALAPSAFQRLVELVVKGIDNVVVYIDDLFIHSKTHEEHLALLDAVFQGWLLTTLGQISRSVCLVPARRPT
jgi:hypothetical protein